MHYVPEANEAKAEAEILLSIHRGEDGLRYLKSRVESLQAANEVMKRDRSYFEDELEMLDQPRLPMPYPELDEEMTKRRKDSLEDHIASLRDAIGWNNLSILAHEEASSIHIAQLDRLYSLPPKGEYNEM